MSAGARETGRIGHRAATLVAAIVAATTLGPSAHAQDLARDPARDAAEGSAGAARGATGFLLADGMYGTLPETGPLPKASPLDPEDRAENDDDGPATRIVLPTPLPAERPETPAERRVADAPPTAVGEGDAVADALPPVRERLAESDEEFAACTARLTELGASFEPVDPLVETKDPDCGILRPIEVTEIAPGVALDPDATMRCATARALAEWTVGDVLPAAEALGATVTAIDHGSTYICRRRNNRPTGKLSEHSFGNAVDVMGFRFETREAIRIEPRAPGEPEATFQRAVREASCEHFTTVIGPGTDAAHADHLHLDIKERRGGYRLCQ